MALDARHRSSIYGKLIPVLGEDDANALMTEFPSVEADELVTKQFVCAELAELRGEFRGEMAELRTDLRGEIGSVRSEVADLRTEMGSEFADVRGEIAGLRTDMAELRTDLTVRIVAAIAAATAVLGTLNLIG